MNRRLSNNSNEPINFTLNKNNQIFKFLQTKFIKDLKINNNIYKHFSLIKLNNIPNINENSNINKFINNNNNINNKNNNKNNNKIKDCIIFINLENIIYFCNIDTENQLNFSKFEISDDLNNIKRFNSFLFNNKNNNISIIFFFTSNKQIFSYFNNKLICLFDISEIENLEINDIYFQEENEILNENDNNTIFVLLSNKIIVEINFCLNSNNNEKIINFIKEKLGLNSNKNDKNKNKNKNFSNTINSKISTSVSNNNNNNENEINEKFYNSTNFEYFNNENKKIIEIFYINFSIPNTNIKSLFIYSNKIETYENIKKICFYKQKFFVLILNTNNIRIINYNNKTIQYQYYSNFDVINNCNFSKDGNLLSVCSQDNNVYIIDLNWGKILFKLEGHKNYVNKIIFNIHKQNENNNNNNNKNNNNNNNNFINGLNIHRKKNIFKEEKKEKLLFDWFNHSLQKNNKNLTPNKLIRSMTSLKTDNNINIIYYDVFSFGLDGQIGSYRIEIEENKNEKINEIQNEDYYHENNDNNNNDNNNNNIKTKRSNFNLENNIIIKKLKMKKSILIENDNNNEIENIHFIYLNKVLNVPIIDFYFINENNGLLLSRNNYSFSYIYLILFYKNFDDYYEEDINDEKDTLNIKNINSFMTHKMDELNKKYIKTKSN